MIGDRSGIDKSDISLTCMRSLPIDPIMCEKYKNETTSNMINIFYAK